MWGVQFRRAIGGEGDAPGQFRSPVGVAVARGMLVVSEQNGRMQVLTVEGVPVQVLELDVFAGPMGLCVDEEHQHACVTDPWAATNIHILRLRF